MTRQEKDALYAAFRSAIRASSKLTKTLREVGYAVYASGSDDQTAALRSTFKAIKEDNGK